MIEQKDTRKKIIRVVLRGPEIDKFESIRADLSIYNPIDVMRMLVTLYTQHSFIAQRPLESVKAVGRPRSEEKARFEKLYVNLENMKPEDLFAELGDIGFFDYVKNVTWEGDPEWSAKELSIHMSPNEDNKLAPKLRVGIEDVYDEKELVAQLKKFYKWKTANQK